MKEIILFWVFNRQCSIGGGAIDVMLKHEAFRDNLSLANTQIDTPAVFLLTGCW